MSAADCACTVVYAAQDKLEAGSYSAGGGQIEFFQDNGTLENDDYCVTEDTLHLTITGSAIETIWVRQ